MPLQAPHISGSTSFVLFPNLQPLDMGTLSSPTLGSAPSVTALAQDPDNQPRCQVGMGHTRLLCLCGAQVAYRRAHALRALMFPRSCTLASRG